MLVADTIIQAINEKRRVSVIREGYERLICPYRIGWSKEDNHNVLHYQIGGYSQSGLKEPGSSANWRCHHLDSFSDATIVDGEFVGPIVKPRSRGKCVVRVEAEVTNYY